jgi:amidohydrolase
MNIADDFRNIRRTLHQNAQTAFEEDFASQLIQSKLKEWDIPFVSGIAKTGIIATITGKTDSGRAIGLRADMDALNILEQTNQPWASQNHGKMHACGHDGHITMLLAAAQYLSKTRNFDGKVHLIFQPAEEGAGGAEKMIKEGLFQKFPMHHIFAVHNWPYLPTGKIAMRVGGIMASDTAFDITVQGVGGHAAMPHCCKDPVPIVAQMITALQTIVSRNINPIDQAVLSVTNLKCTTGADNIIADKAEFSIIIRAFDPSVRDFIVQSAQRIIHQIAAAFDVQITMNCTFDTPATVNDADAIAISCLAAADVVGEDNVIPSCDPYMTAEDFGVMLQQTKGSFVFIGQGVDGHNHGLHSPHYDFNDDIIPIGAAYFIRLAERALSA